MQEYFLKQNFLPIILPRFSEKILSEHLTKNYSCKCFKKISRNAFASSNNGSKHQTEVLLKVNPPTTIQERHMN